MMMMKEMVDNTPVRQSPPQFNVRIRKCLSNPDLSDYSLSKFNPSGPIGLLLDDSVSVQFNFYWMNVEELDHHGLVENKPRFK